MTTATPGAAGASLADGEWHRLHPLTPLFKGGLFLVIVLGIVIANMREKIVLWVVKLFTPNARIPEFGGDPVDWVLSNNLAIVALLAVVGVVVVLIAAFWLVWRFQQFRITGEHVEVRKGIVFRSHRRAPLDRVQGVNLTRPFPARVIGLAKLEVVGAGTDANVPLEYLSTTRAESVRADILRLASGARHARDGGLGADAPAQRSMRAQLGESMNQGVTGLITGVDLDDVAPEHVLRIPTGRLIGSHVISGATWLVFMAVVFVALMAVLLPQIVGRGDSSSGFIALGVALATGIPMAFAAIAVTWARIARSLRYSIAPTPDGVRITFGLFTTITETIPPGRIFAVEVMQPLLWRPFGWWSVRINRMSGRSASQQQSSTAQQFNIVLPVGARADVERVLGLILPDAPREVVPLIWEQGVLGPQPGGDPYATIPGRAWWRRPLSWRRHGIALTPFAVLQRRGRIWRQLAIFPLARLQGFSVHQGPIDRFQRVGEARVHTVTGPVHGEVSGIESSVLLKLLEVLGPGAARAAENDRAHRWAEHEGSATGWGTGAVAGGLPAAPVGPATTAMPTIPVPPAASGAPAASAPLVAPAPPAVPPGPSVGGTHGVPSAWTSVPSGSASAADGDARFAPPSAASAPTPSAPAEPVAPAPATAVDPPVSTVDPVAPAPESRRARRTAPGGDGASSSVEEPTAADRRQDGTDPTGRSSE